MNSSICWKRLDVTLDPSVILNTIPLNTVVICLQLCPYRQVLYACIGIRTVPSVLTSPVAATGGKKVTPAEAAATAAAEAKGSPSYLAGGDWTVSKVALSEANRRLLLTLTAQHTLWREDTTKFISKYGDCLAANGDLEGVESQHSDVKIRKTEAALEERLRALLSDMETVVEEVLGPASTCYRFLTEHFHGCFPPIALPSTLKETFSEKRDEMPAESSSPSSSPRPGSAKNAILKKGSISPRSTEIKPKSSSPPRPGSAKPGKSTPSKSGSLSGRTSAKSRREEKTKEDQPTLLPLPSAILLIDPTLQSLPWEGLPVIEQYFAGKTCRDFSIHMHGHRLVALQGSLSQPQTVSKDGKETGTGTNPNGSNVSASFVRVLADPFDDDQGSVALGYERDGIRNIVDRIAGSTIVPEGQSIRASFKGMVAVGGKWSHMVGGEAYLAAGEKVVPANLSLQDWIAACNKKPSVVGKGDTPLGSGCILAYAPGRLSALLNPRDVVSLNMESLALLFIADQSQNDSSYRRQNSSDNMKQYEEIALEQPLDVATLLSLAGVGSLVVHRYVYLVFPSPPIRISLLLFPN